MGRKGDVVVGMKIPAAIGVFSPLAGIVGLVLVRRIDIGHITHDCHAVGADICGVADVAEIGIQREDLPVAVCICIGGFPFVVIQDSADNHSVVRYVVSLRLSEKTIEKSELGRIL